MITREMTDSHQDPASWEEDNAEYCDSCGEPDELARSFEHGYLCRQCWTELYPHTCWGQIGEPLHDECMICDQMRKEIEG